MFRHSLVLVAGLCWVSPAAAASWADGMFRELTKDFGSVPRGPRLEHPFRLTNNTRSHVHISGVRTSCGCTTAYAVQTDLAPGQETAILAYMDTNRFSGVRNVTIYVTIDQPHHEEVRLWVQANSRDDVSVTPESLAYGQIKRGSAPAANVTVTFLGDGQLQVTAVQCDSNYVQATLQQISRNEIQVAYQLTARLRPDAPVGKWYSDIWLKTHQRHHAAGAGAVDGRDRVGPEHQPGHRQPGAAQGRRPRGTPGHRSGRSSLPHHRGAGDRR